MQNSEIGQMFLWDGRPREMRRSCRILDSDVTPWKDEVPNKGEAVRVSNSERAPIEAMRRASL